MLKVARPVKKTQSQKVAESLARRMERTNQVGTMPVGSKPMSVPKAKTTPRKSPSVAKPDLSKLTHASTGKKVRNTTKKK